MDFNDADFVDRITLGQQLAAPGETLPYHIFLHAATKPTVGGHKAVDGARRS